MTESTTGSTQALGRTLIDEFGRGWAKAKVDVIMSVFAPEPVFQDTPFSEPLRGRDAVKGYWADVPLFQSEISFTAGEIFTVGPWFATEFKCTFRRRRTGEWVDARGSIFCETNGEKITEMRMYWERR
jgi:ketosteroid isomerase-like protein